MCKNSRWCSWLGDFVSSAFSADSAVNRNLKKQTQFSNGQIGVKLIMIMVCGDSNGLRQRKNKAKQSQFLGNGRYWT